jgi:hypothetical protein
MQRILILCRGAALSSLLILSVARPSRGQLPNTPVLQNAFANPGITAAVDASSLSGWSSFAGAAAWAPASGRLQLSAGVGAQTHSGEPTRTVYGGRLNIPVAGATSAFGFSAFVGYGGLSGGTVDSTVAKALLPVGVTAGYRKAVGTTRGVSIYGSPVYEWVTRGGGASTVSVFRAALGMDLGITSSIGLTLGLEFGSKQSEGSGKPSGTAFGGAISYAFSAGR